MHDDDDDNVASPVLLERNDHDADMADARRSALSASSNPRRPVSRRQAFRGDHPAPAQIAHRQSKTDPTSLILNQDDNDGWNETPQIVPDAGTLEARLSTFAKENIPRPVVRDWSPARKRRGSDALDAPEKDSLSDAELVEYFAERMRQLPLVYGFKSPDPFDISEKAMGTGQFKNAKSKYSLLTKRNQRKTNTSTETSRTNSFESKKQRKPLLPKIEATIDRAEFHTSPTAPIITSSFRSSTDRFPKKTGKIPGPGTYDRVSGFPTHKQLGTYLSRGIYFNSSFS